MKGSLLEHRESPTALPLIGLEPDNLLAILALLGLLRALEEVRPAWRPRASWSEPPWTARLHLDEVADEAAVMGAAAEGIRSLAARFDVDGRQNVDFDREGFRSFVSRVKGDAVPLALASALTAEFPEKRAGGLRAAPLVFMFGQGHQDFLKRLAAVNVTLPAARRGRKRASAETNIPLDDPQRIGQALFQPWSRTDPTDGFRWDPEEDQRYALRFSDPSRDGAAPTVHGANRLAALGFLSFSCAPGPNLAAPGWATDGLFVWPIWSPALSRAAVEALLTHPDLIERRPDRLRPLGVQEIMAARRVSNGKFMNVTRALPAQEAAGPKRGVARR